MSISEHAAEALLNDIDQELGGEVSFIFHTNSLRISAIAHMRPEELELKMEGFIVLCDCLTLIFNRVVDTGQWGARLITLALLLREGGTLVH
ncbi:MAG: hypothetical protein Q8P58_02725 [Candidatus Adlerbacteria bacterium]|nr:hypothetical protein [Candidatus Adlerbacteria bacterium]